MNGAALALSTRHSSLSYTLPCKLSVMESGWSAESIARLRARLGLTQAGMARALGVRQQTVSEWETGRYEPRGASRRMLEHLAESREPYDPDGGPG